MLYLTRKKGETIYAFLEDGRNIEINIMEIGNFYDNSAVKIGINAPRDIKLIRQELLTSEQYNLLCSNELKKEEGLEINSSLPHKS